MLVDFRPCLGGCEDAPHLGERVHIEGHVVDFAVEVRNRGVYIVVELSEPIDVIPYVSQ